MPHPFSQNILITGGAGFLGRGILRYMERERLGGKVTVYSRDEQKHYALRARFPHVRTVLGDVCDLDRLTAVMAGHDVVIHAAALKHIPEAERDVAEAIRINVVGSQNVAHAAMVSGVKQVVAISTDKACSPRNSYGASKMMMERLFQEAGRLSGVRFTVVRYGNVISSTGSVVPLFLDQIARQDRVLITSRNMTRFWVSVDDAVRLIERALSDDGRRGYTYVLRCPAMTLPDVAQAVWALAGRPGKVVTDVIGVRPGEKLHETLVDGYESQYAMEDGRYVLIPPALSMAGEGSNLVNEYESDRPDHWLLAEEMTELIKDASTI